MAAADDAVMELQALLDEGVHLSLSGTDGHLTLEVRVDEGCEECLVPDAVMHDILTEALTRRGIAFEDVEVRHAAAPHPEA